MYNTDAPSGNKVNIGKNLNVLYFDPTPMGQVMLVKCGKPLN